MNLIHRINNLLEPAFKEKKDEFEFKLEQFINHLLFFSALFSLPAVIYSVKMAVLHGQLLIAAADTVSYMIVLSLLVFKRINFRKRGFVMIALFFLLGSLILHKAGPMSAGILYLFSAPLFAAMLLDFRIAVFIILLSAVVLIGNTSILLRNTGTTPADLELWLIFAVNFIVLEGILTFSISSLFSGLKKTHDSKKNALKAAALSEKRMQLVLDNNYDSMIFCNADWLISYKNTGAERLFEYFGLSDPESIFDLFPEAEPDEYVIVEKYFRDFIAGSQKKGIMPFKLAAGRESRYLEFAFLNMLDDPLLKSIVITIRDITEIKRAEDRIAFYQNNDPLTGLPNESGFRNALEKEVRKAAGRKQKLAVVSLGMAEFKKLRFRFEKEYWNNILINSAERLKGLFRDDDFAARLHSDRFAVILYEINSTRDVPTVLAKIDNAFSVPVSAGAQGCSPSIRIKWLAGVTFYPDDFQEPDELLRQSENCLDYLQNNDLTGYMFFNNETHSMITRQIETEDMILSSLSEGRFFLQYQPKVFSNGTVSGFEALVRCRAADGSVIPPDHFIPVAERSGLIKEIGNMVIMDVARQLAVWKMLKKEIVPVAINVSPVQLNDKSFVPWLMSVLSSEDIDPDMIELEITERDIQTDEETIIATMTELKGLGIKFSIDDFGTGYSSLIRLKEYPVSAVKIDKAFVQDLPHNAESSGIVESVLLLAKNLKFEVVAEGVETRSQLDFLEKMGCSLYQGYYFHKPLDPEDAFEIID